jgi:hypothetical protein
MGDGGHTRTRLAERCDTASHTTAVVSVDEVTWLVAHLRAVDTASPAAWAHRGTTLLQQTAPHFTAQAPVSLTDSAQALGTEPPGHQRDGRSTNQPRASMQRDVDLERLSEMVNEVDTGQYEVMIEGEGHPWAKDTISVAEIRELGKLPADAPVIEQDLRDGSERTLTEDDVLRPGKLREGARLTKKRVNFRMG